MTHLEAILKKCRETFSKAIPFLQEAGRYFKTTHPTESSLPFFEERLLSYHWSSIIYDAFFLATLKTGKKIPLAEEILLARRRAMSALEAHHPQRAHTWSLIASIKENIFEALEHRTDEHEKQSVALLEKQLLNGNPSEAWERATCWLLVATEAQRKTNKSATDCASLISRAWQRASNFEMGKKLIHQLPFFLNTGHG